MAGQPSYSITMALRAMSSRLLHATTTAIRTNGVALARPMSSLPSLEFVKVEMSGTDGRVGLVSLNRPKALNALCSPLMDDLMTALR